QRFGRVVRELRQLLLDERPNWLDESNLGALKSEVQRGRRAILRAVGLQSSRVMQGLLPYSAFFELFGVQPDRVSEQQAEELYRAMTCREEAGRSWRLANSPEPITLAEPEA